MDVLYRHGIMKGSWQPDGTVAFQPHSGVKRSEFAAISNRVFNNAGTDYDISKEMYNHKIESGQKVKSDKLRITGEATVIGSETGCSAVSGLSLIHISIRRFPKWVRAWCRSRANSG